MGPPVTALVLAVFLTASNGLPRQARDEKANFIADGTSEIAAAIFQSYIDEEKNIAFSPMGNSALMAILAEGARGDTKAQLVNALHLPADDHVIRAAYKNVLENLKERFTLNVPEFHTWFYVYKNYSIDPEFKNILKENYLTEVKNVEPLYETVHVDPPNPELEAVMHLDNDENNEKVKHDKEDMVTEKQESVSGNKDMMLEKEEIKLENQDATSQKEDMAGGMKDIPEKQDEMPEKELMSDKQEKMPEKQNMNSDENKNVPNTEMEFEVTPEMIENKPDSIRDPFLEALLNKELEDKRKKDHKDKEEMEEIEGLKESELKGGTTITSSKEESMMPGNEPEEDMIKKETERLRRSVKFSTQDTVADKKRNENVNEEKEESITKEEDYFGEGALMEESVLIHAVKEGAMIEEALKGEKHTSYQEKGMEEEPKKEISTLETQPMSEMSKEKPAVSDTNVEMSTMGKTEKEKLSIGEREKKKSNTKKETMEIVDRSKRISRGLLGKQDLASGISGNSIVKKASEKPEDSLMIVFNALYYRGSWGTPFRPQKRGLADVFYASGTKKLSVPTMCAEGTFNIGNIPELDSVAIELPYKGDRYSLTVVLPNQKDGLRPLIAEHLAKYSLKNIVKNLSPKQVQVCLPSFEVETTTNPTDALKMLGITDLFSRERANLSGISKESGLFVDDLAQFVTIKVESDHSETNYLTGSSVFGPETRTEYEEKFIADHPFIYLVMDKTIHNMIVVAGKVTDPTYKPPPFIKKVKF